MQTIPFLSPLQFSKLEDNQESYVRSLLFAGLTESEIEEKLRLKNRFNEHKLNLFWESVYTCEFCKDGRLCPDIDQ